MTISSGQQPLPPNYLAIDGNRDHAPTQIKFRPLRAPMSFSHPRLLFDRFHSDPTPKDFIDRLLFYFIDIHSYFIGPKMELRFLSPDYCGKSSTIDVFIESNSVYMAYGTRVGAVTLLFSYYYTVSNTP